GRESQISRAAARLPGRVGAPRPARPRGRAATRRARGAAAMAAEFVAGDGAGPRLCATDPANKLGAG
ncbi:hypothetical protein, partial [Mycobacterium sp. IS-1264]|uniref:hypothetical protein n=1 Tax=Mycobacterium sp. IS-1264 TaxID=1834158 RepID=UPI00197BA53F